jgi:hypothetical protein
MGLRERAKAKGEFLELLAASPYSDLFVLYGSGALHGVYLHARYPEDLDFMVPEELAERLGENPLSLGLPLKHITRDDGTVALVYQRPGTVYPMITVTLDIKPTDLALVSAQNARFTSGIGESFPVHCRLLEDELRQKWLSVCGRQEATDFADIYLAWERVPELLNATRSAIYDTAALWENYHAVKDGWDEKLEGLLLKPLAHEAVASVLE